MKRTEINAMLKCENISYMKGDEEAIIGFVTRLIIAKKNHLAKTEPYAVRTLDDLAMTIRALDDLMDDIEEVEEDA